MNTGRKQIAFLLIISALLLAACGKAETPAPEEPAKTDAAVVDTVRTDDFEMDYCRFGTGEKALVILPGLSVQSVMGSADAIARQYAQFTDDYTVYVFDRRKEVPQSYSIQEMAKDTDEAIRTLGLKKVSVFGASQGGMIAMCLAIQDPELIEQLLLASSSCSVGDKEFETIAQWIGFAERNDAEGLYLAFGEAVYPEAVFEQSRDLLIDAAKTVTEEELKKFIIIAEAIRGFDITDEMKEIKCPVLIIGDQDDRVLGGEAALMIKDHVSESSDSELFMYEGYGHAVYDMAPDFGNRMLEFLKKH